MGKTKGTDHVNRRHIVAPTGNRPLRLSYHGVRRPTKKRGIAKKMAPSNLWWNRLAAQEPADVARRARVHFSRNGSYEVPVLDRTYRIDARNREISQIHPPASDAPDLDCRLDAMVSGPAGTAQSRHLACTQHLGAYRGTTRPAARRDRRRYRHTGHAPRLQRLVVGSVTGRVPWVAASGNARTWSDNRGFCIVISVFS